jgi:glutathione S-transferase
MALKMGFVKGDAVSLGEKHNCQTFIMFKDKQRKETFLPAMEKFMPILEKLLAEAGSGFMLPSGISYVDIQIAYILAATNKMDPEAMGKYPKLVEYSDRVHGQPKLKEYLAKRKA